MARIHLVLLVLSIIAVLASASSAPTFCKCTCSKNSTIIPLEDSDNTSAALLHRALFADSHELPLDARDQRQQTTRATTSPCAGCTKAFCLSQDLDICQDVEEEDVTTMCFQRDSNKDRIIVWAFIVAVLGLLGWTTFKRVREWRETRGLGEQNVTYMPVGSSR